MRLGLSQGGSPVSGARPDQSGWRATRTAPDAGTAGQVGPQLRHDLAQQAVSGSSPETSNWWILPEGKIGADRIFADTGELSPSIYQYIGRFRHCRNAKERPKKRVGARGIRGILR